MEKFEYFFQDMFEVNWMTYLLNFIFYQNTHFFFVCRNMYEKYEVRSARRKRAVIALYILVKKKKV